MNILILNASPRRKGNISQMLEVIEQEALSSGAEVNVALHKGKKAVVVTASSTMWPFNIIMNQTRGVVKALKEILGWSGFKMVATVQKGGTFRHPEFTDADRKKCLKAARKLKIK